MQQTFALTRLSFKKIFMKKFSVLLAGVLFCTQVFAGGPDDLKSTAASSIAVTKASGSTIVKLYYKSEVAGNVAVSIFNNQGKEVFRESLSSTKGFIRPYNFETLPEGEYTVEINDGNGKMIEKVMYAEDRIQKLINVRKLGSNDKYLVTVNSQKKEDLTILISDSNDNLVYREAVTVDGEFGKIYNIKDLKSFSIEVIDSQGVLKKIVY